MKKWLIIFLLPSIVVFLQYIYLKQIYEIKSIEKIVERQIEKNSIYGAAFNSNVFNYKLSLIKKVNPEIIALGSSTIMTLKQEIFEKSFINAGGAMNNVDEGILFVQELEKLQTKPKFVILNLDFWWFNKVYNQYDNKDFLHHKNTVDKINLNTLYNFNKSLFLKKIPLYSLNYIFKNNDMVNRYTSQDSLGLSAITKGSGYKIDGSYDYGNLLFGDGDADIKFQNTLNRIENQNARFQIGEIPDQKEINKLKYLITSIENLNLDYVVLIPPISSTVYSRIDRNKNYSYIYKTFEILKDHIKGNIKIFFDPNFSNSNDCEFIDGFHPGSVSFAKIFLKSRFNKKEFLIDEKKLTNLIDKNIGQASISNNQNLKFRETDFLKLGCEKKANNNK